jgi:hypothetical protein
MEPDDEILDFFLDYDLELSEFTTLFLTKNSIFSINLIL